MSQDGPMPTAQQKLK